MTQTASATITFVSESAIETEGYSLKVELDDEKNEEVYGEKKSRFEIGETAYIRVFAKPISMNLQFFLSSGVYSEEGTGRVVKSEVLTFSNSNEKSLSYPLVSESFTQVSTDTDDAQTYMWYGRAVGSVSFENGNVKLSQTGYGVLKINYRSNFRRYGIKLTSVPDGVSEFPVIVGITGTVES